MREENTARQSLINHKSIRFIPLRNLKEVLKASRVAANWVDTTVNNAPIGIVGKVKATARRPVALGEWASKSVEYAMNINGVNSSTPLQKIVNQPVQRELPTEAPQGPV